ncbi:MULTISPECIES: di-heme oxidoredictase family protein [Corallococcus]|uniref:di-heme oxidoredictase family protein n=1 Tax=Corallococcus TaxID=83461 RepID=UPI00272A8A5C|nr:di-heme oxidoredictase family protein [Corallococcus sp. AB030]
MATLLLLGACGDDDPTPQPSGNTNAGVTVDAGTDAGTQTDAGPQAAAPTVSFTSPTEGAQVEAFPVQVQAVVRAEGGLATLAVTPNSGTATNVPVTQGQTEQSVTVPVEPVAGGNTVVLRAVDAAGQATEATLHFTYVAPTVDTQAPTLALTSPTEGQDLTVYQVSVTGRATDNVAVTGLTWQLNGGAEESATVNGHTRLLHDGRARSVLEAILWHGGEAQASHETVQRISPKERAALLAFLDSL